MKTVTTLRYLMVVAGTTSVSLLHAQAVQVISHTIISAQPPDPISYEKAIGNFTSPSYPSYFLGTNLDGYVFDTQNGQSCSLGIPADYYERAQSFTYPGDQYSGIIASLYTNVTWLENPLNGGLSLCNDWGTQVINPNRGAHELHVVDLDGDGKLDVLASGTEFPDDHPNSFISFQNSYNSWVLGTHPPPAGESIDVIAVSGVNGGARTNIVACNPSNNSLYWYQNPGGNAARTSKWKAHLIASASLAGQPACTQGITLASMNVGDRDIVIVASSETENNEFWPPGLGYFDPGSKPDGRWRFHQIDGTFLDVHQIASDILNGNSFFTIAEQEQASSICNGEGLDDHGSEYSGCRVAIFQWNGNGFQAPTILSNLGSHNQSLYQLNGVEYIAGTNHDSYIATDPAYNLWTFTFTQAGKVGSNDISTRSAP